MLLSLQQVGNVNYTGWVLQVPCSTDRWIIAELQAQAKLMEDELLLWNEIVRCRREEFYELNYFTTLQLLTLRRELGKLKNSSKIAAVSPEVLALLQSISALVASDVVSDTVNKVMSEAITESVSEPLNDDSDVSEIKETVNLPAFHDVDNKETAEVKTVVNKDKPALTENDLSKEQKAIMANICARLDCPKQLVLKSFEKCPGNNNDRYDYENWCGSNLLKYEFQDDDGESDDDGSESESDSESTHSSDDGSELINDREGSPGIMNYIY